MLLDVVTSQCFSGVFLVCNEEVLPEGSLCFTVWVLVAAVVVLLLRPVLVNGCCSGPPLDVDG